MNEGCATYCHYRIMNTLHETRRIGDGSFLEFLRSAHQRNFANQIVTIAPIAG